MRGIIVKTLLIKNLSKKYEIGKDKHFTALKPTNLSFNSTGLVSIVGKSGSGKSTLINLIARIDTPSSGEIYLNGKEYSKFKKKDEYHFHNKEIGIVFQNYNLLEDQTVLMNVELPLLIGGASKKQSKQKAKEMLEKVGVPSELFNNLASKLSGGEKQRVGIARAMVNSPKILICDEPTGALDTDNSISVMNLIKTISNDVLVLLVSHNLQLVEKYSDRIIEISDGKVIKDITINPGNEAILVNRSKTKSSSDWIDKLVNRNYIKRIKRNLFSLLTFSISLTMMYLVIGFISNKDNSIKEASYRQFDFGVGYLSIESKTGGAGMLSVVKTSRPDYEFVKSKAEISKKYEICLNYSSILPQNIQISYDSQIFDDLNFAPIYSFEDNYVDKSLLSFGSIPKEDNLSEVVVNEVAFKAIEKEMGKSPLNEKLNFKYLSTFIYVDESGEYISDTFDFDMNMTITGVVKEINYLPSSKIYYSYSALNEYMKDKVLVNLSTYNDNKITWFDRVNNADNNALISSYSYLLFLKDYRDRESGFDKSIFTDGLVYTSQSILLAESLFNFLEVAEYGVILFLIITFVGSILILSIMSFTSFSEDHKNSAILSSLGASNEQIQEIYLEESILNGVLSFLISTPIAIGLSKLINALISKIIDLNNLIQIPFERFLNIRFLLPLVVFIGIVLIVSLSTIIPIIFSKKKSIRGELQSL